MGDLTQNFSRWEFECPCGCRHDHVHEELVERLQKVRTNFGPITVNSGCRCEAHNRTVGGKTASAHLRGWAVDLRCPNSFSRFHLLKHLVNEGFRRIGIGQGFIHVDFDPGKPQSLIWLY